MLRSATSSLLRMAARPSATMLLTRTKTTGQIGVLSGAPKDELERKVYIFRPAKSASQHASAAVPGYAWKLSFEKKDRWVNPLMGWTSSADSLAGQTPGNMNFESKDAAIAFAEKNGERRAFFCHRAALALYVFSAAFSGWKIILEEPNNSKVCVPFSSASASPPSSPLIHLFQVNKVRAKSYGENYQWEGESDMEGTVRLRLTHK
jgi:hypothetical protein